MKINASDTQRQAYKEVIESGLVDREIPIVLEALRQHQPCTRRELHEITGLEISNLCRCLFNLVNVELPRKPLVEIAFSARCRKTGKKVYYYKLAGDDNMSCLCKLTPDPTQPTLFQNTAASSCCNHSKDK